jgi:hypothetical protein
MDGALWDGKQLLELPEQKDLFNALGLRWIDPRDRARPLAFGQLVAGSPTRDARSEPIVVWSGSNRD